MTSTQIRDSAWGIRVSCPQAKAELLLPSVEAWPLVEVSVEVGEVEPSPGILDDTRADLGFYQTGRVRLRRDELTSQIILPSLPSPDAVIHPYLASTATIVNHWHGRTCFHAGGLLTRDGVWAVVGDREDGKSSSLAFCMTQGVSVVTDDVLAVTGDEAFAGPRCLDLREGAARQLGLGCYLPGAGDRARWRVRLGDVPPVAPLLGWIFLAWEDQSALRPLSASALLPRLVSALAMSAAPEPTTLLRLAALPGWTWARPRRWEALAEATDLLLQRIG